MLGSILFILSFWILDWLLGAILFMTGLLGISIYLLFEVLKDIFLKRNSLILVFTKISLILMCVTIFSKYFHQRFFDYPTLLIVPTFLIISAVYIITQKQRDPKIIASIIVFSFLLIPMFGVSFTNSPNSYFPNKSNTRYNVSEGVEMTLPYEYKNDNALLLRNRANRFRQSKEFDSAVTNYRKGLTIDPKNPIFYFELSDCYARTNNLEKAISLLDSAILIDSYSSAFYNNRGLLYYKSDSLYSSLKDYSAAVFFDSTNKVAFGNLALVYYDLNNIDKACECIKKAESLGLDISKEKKLLRIKRNNCE